jgi:hypothetical protein
MAWWVPTAVIVAGLLASIPLRTGIWIAALTWMGVACLLNARRSGRTHCRFTGPYYLLMIVPMLVLGMMDAPLYAWLVLAVFVFWVTRSYGGRRNTPGERFLHRARREASPSTPRGHGGAERPRHCRSRADAELVSEAALVASIKVFRAIRDAEAWRRLPPWGGVPPAPRLGPRVTSRGSQSIRRRIKTLFMPSM